MISRQIHVMKDEENSPEPPQSKIEHWSGLHFDLLDAVETISPARAERENQDRLLCVARLFDQPEGGGK